MISLLFTAIDIKSGKLTKAEFENELTPLPEETDRRYILSELIDKL